jgi:hypothetical protein
MGSFAWVAAMKRTSEERRQVRLQAEQRALATVEHFLKQVAPGLVAEQLGAGLSRDECESLVKQVESSIEPQHWKAVRKHLRKRLKKLEVATGGSVYLPPPATYIRRDKSPLAGNAMTLVSELEVLIERFLVDVRENLDAPVHPVTIERKMTEKESKKKDKKRAKEQKKSEEQKEADRKKAEKQKAKREHNYRLRTLGRIVFSAIVNGGLLNQSLYRKLLPNSVTDFTRTRGWPGFRFPSMTEIPMTMTMRSQRGRASTLMRRSGAGFWTR